MERPRILLVEDEESIRKTITLNLNLEGYEVVDVKNGKEAIHALPTQHFDLIILDIMLPEMDGYHVCEHIRLRDHTVPIIFVTAKDGSKDRIKGLKLGADDYLVKPFHLEELLLRVKNLLKRSFQPVKHELKSYRFGSNYVDFTTYEAETSRGKIKLTQKEILLIKLLIDRKNEVVSRQDILQFVWGYDVFPSTRTV